MNTPSTNVFVKHLRRLVNMGEMALNGATWTKFSETQEFKVSPHGPEGDYDKDAFWVSYDELEDHFSSANPQASIV